MYIQESSRIGTIVIVLFGLLFVVFGGTSAWNNYKHTQYWVSDSGVVVEIKSKSGDNGTLYVPIVRFSVDTTPYTFQRNYWSDPVGVDIDDAVAIIYNPQNPTDARVDSILGRYGFGLLFALFGAIFAIIGGGIFSVQEKKKHRTQRLRQIGITTTATVKHIIWRYPIKNGVSTRQKQWYKIEAEGLHPVTMHTQQFHSEWRRGNPSTSPSIGESVTVYIHPQHANDYYIAHNLQPTDKG